MSEQKLCRHFLKDNCRKGDQCLFVHSKPSPQAEEKRNSGAAVNYQSCLQRLSKKVAATQKEALNTAAERALLEEQLKLEDTRLKLEQTRYKREETSLRTQKMQRLAKQTATQSEEHWKSGSYNREEDKQWENSSRNWKSEERTGTG